MVTINRKEKRIIIIVTGAVIALCFIIMLFHVLFGGAQNVVSKYAQGMKHFNSEKIVELYNNQMIKESYSSEKEMIKDYDEMFKYLKEDYYKINSYSISDNYKVYKDDELDYKINELVEHYNFKEKEIKEIRLYTVTFECIADGESKEVDHKVLVAKINGHWYYIGNEA